MEKFPRYDNSRVASCKLRVVSCELVFTHILRVASCELRVASCELRDGFHHINSVYSFVPILDSKQNFLRVSLMNF